MAQKKKKYNDLSLGTKETSGCFHLLNKDGSFNLISTKSIAVN